MGCIKSITKIFLLMSYYLSIFRKSIMSRSIWKGPFSLLKSKNKPFLSSQKQNSIVSVWSRHSMILPENVGKQYNVYNGKQWALRKVVEKMVGHKFGEFFSTKKRTIHKLNKRKQVSRKK